MAPWTLPSMMPNDISDDSTQSVFRHDMPFLSIRSHTVGLIIRQGRSRIVVFEDWRRCANSAYWYLYLDLLSSKREDKIDTENFHYSDLNVPWLLRLVKIRTHLLIMRKEWIFGIQDLKEYARSMSHCPSPSKFWEPLRMRLMRHFETNASRCTTL